VLGTAAIANPDLVREAARAHPGRIVVGIDARKGKVAVDGWTRATETTARELADALAGAGVTAIVYTDIDRDGVLGGPNIEATVALAKGLPVPVIASGGVSTLDDIAALRARGFAHEIGIGDGGRAQHHAAHAGLEPGFDARAVADAATQLHRHGDGFENGGHGRRILGLTGDGTVEIDHMQPARAGRFERARLGGRIVVVDRGVVHGTLAQANAATVL
jgi:hypothetical protein